MNYDGSFAVFPPSSCSVFFYCFSSALNLFESNETCLQLRWGIVFQLEFYHMKAV